MNNPIIEELKIWAGFGLPYMQAEYAKKVLADAKPVQCVSVWDVFTPGEIQTIRRILRPKKGECYRNAALLTELFPKRVKYVEGYGWGEIVKVEHAFNMVDGKYIDITWELALRMDVSKIPYVSLIEAKRDDLWADIFAHDNTYGGYYIHKYIESLGGERRVAEMLDEQAAKTLEKGGAISELIKKAGTL